MDSSAERNSDWSDGGRSEGSGPLPPALRAAFGFDGSSDADWFSHLRSQTRSPSAGRIGPYEIISEAGRGGQGLVYRARQQRPAREVALKRLAAGVFATPSMRARFEREIEATAALDHPNIVRLFGVEQFDEQLAVAMQWIDGVPLDRWARPAPFEPRPIPAVLDVFMILCSAIDHAHQRGIIHRDLKPTNVLVDAAGQPHVLDFGLARRGEDSEAGLTQTGAFLGTPAFASPEQLRSENETVNAGSDVYALGAMLYACLTGAAPVDGSLPPAEILRQMERAGPVAPAVRNPRIDRDLSAITMQAMHADPTQRYQSVAALAADLSRYKRGEPVQARPPSATYRLRKYVSRNRGGVAVVGGYILLTTAAAVISTVLFFRAEDQRHTAEKALLRANLEAGTARGSKTLLQDIFVSAGRGGSTGGGELTVRALLDRSSEKLAAGSYSLAPAEAAGMHMMIGDAYRELGLNASAEPHYAAALRIRREAYGSESLEVAKSLDALARAHRVLGKPSDAEPLVEEAWRIYKKLLPAKDGYLAQAANSVALIKRSLKKYEEAENWYMEALNRYIDSFGPESENIPYVKINLGSLYVSVGRLADAESMFRDALERSQKLHANSPHEDTAIAMSSLADVLAQQGDPLGNAESLFRVSHQMAQSLYGANHFRVANLLSRFARFLSKDGRSEEALEILVQSRAIYQSGQRWDDVLSTAIESAAILRHTGRIHEARISLRNDVEVLSNQNLTQVRALALAYEEIGSLYFECGDPLEAQVFLHCAESLLSLPTENAPLDLLRVRELLGRTESR